MQSFTNLEPSEAIGPYANMNHMLSKMENWAHNLYPKAKFEDFLESIEKLGKKRIIRKAMQKLRHGEELNEADLEGIIDDEKRDDELIDDGKPEDDDRMDEEDSGYKSPS